MVVIKFDVNQESLDCAKKSSALSFFDSLQTYIKIANGFACVAGSYALYMYMKYHDKLNCYQWKPNDMDIWVANSSVEDIWMFILKHFGSKSYNVKFSGG